MGKKDTKTVKLEGGKRMEVQLYGYSAGLSEDSMQSSDESDTKKRPIKGRRNSSKKQVLKSIRRPSNKPKKAPGEDSTSAIRVLLGEDFDIPAFHPKDKAKGKADDEPGSPSEEDDEPDEDEDDSEEERKRRNKSTSPAKRPKTRFIPSHAPVKQAILPQAANSNRPSPALKRAAPEELSATESEEEGPIIRNPPAKRLKASSSPPSVSETESEGDAAPVILRKKLIPKRDSTESDTESEEETTQIWLKLIDPLTDPLRPRPAFKATKEQQKKSALVLDAESQTQVPRSVAMYLRPYQEEGVRFFWNRYREGRGGVLGDDMGLGKTIQVISFLSAIFHKSGNKIDATRRHTWVNEFLDTHKKDELPPANAKWPTCLIVAPKTVVGNWERELATWTYFEVGVYLGSNKNDVLKSFRMGRFDVLLTSHETARDSIADLENLAISCIFVDEAHKIKNARTGTAKAYDRFDCVVRFGLSGTVIQNSYKEIWPLLNWSNPGRLGSEKDWTRYIVKPMLEGQSKDATPQQLLDFRELAKRFVERLLPQFFLRRTKDLIKDQLPKKVDKVVFCPLTETQIKVYERFLGTEDVQLMLRKDERCDCGSKKKRGKCCHVENSDGIPWHKLMLKYIDILVKISNSLLLIYPGPDDSPAQVARNRELMKVAFPDGHAGTYANALTNKGLCGKWDVLSRLLHLWKENSEEKNKILIFSKSVKLLDFLSMWLGATGFSFRQLDGKVKQEDRFKLIDDFNLDPEVFVFLISTLTGGTGLNLVAANKVVIFDPNWNPAHDLQAMDRAYRFGQQRDVSVYRLLGAGSLEELVYARQLYKQQQMRIGYDGSHQTRLFKGVQGNTDKEGELFGLKNILTLRKDLTTKEQIEDAHVDNLEWALANTELGGGGDHDELKDAKSMQILLLDEDAGSQGSQPSRRGTVSEDTIADILNNVGVQYTHVNDNILRDNHVEAKRVAKAREAGRKTKRRSEPTTESRGAAWPPKRAHHKAVNSSAQRLLSRKGAILAAGYDIVAFAEEFAAMTPEQQEAKLRELDTQAAT